MHFITKKDSTTGQKFQEIFNKKNIAFEETKALSEKYGFKEWRSARWQVFGGISSCVSFIEAPDKKIWGKGLGRNEFMPKKNTKIGKTINEEFENLTVVSIHELNDCIDFDGAPFKTIGFSWCDDHFGFVVGDDWEDVVIPKDCEEILASKYKEMFADEVIA